MDMVKLNHAYDKQCVDIVNENLARRAHLYEEARAREEQEQARKAVYARNSFYSLICGCFGLGLSSTLLLYVGTHFTWSSMAGVLTVAGIAGLLLLDSKRLRKKARE